MRITNKFVDRTPVNYSIDDTVLTVKANNTLVYDLAELQQGRIVTINITADDHGNLYDNSIGDRRVMDIKIAPEVTQQILTNNNGHNQVEIIKLREFDVDIDVEITLWAFGVSIPMRNQ